MSVTSVDLLRFILGLLGDSSKAEAFTDDPAGALASAGLSGVSCSDVDAIAPLIANSAPGAFAIAQAGGSGTPGEMIQHIVKNVAVSNFDNNGVIQNIWTTGDVRQAFASEGGLAIGGDLLTDDPIVTGDGNVVATDTAQSAGRDVIQNQGDGNLALGGDQTIAQDNGVIAGGDNLTAGDKVGGNNNEAGNTGNDNSTSIGGNQNNAANTGNSTVHDESTTVGDVDLSQDNSVSVGGNQNNAENTGNSTVHDESTTVGGNQNSAENTGNSTVHDESTTVGDVDASQNASVGGDYWENGSNVGGIGNTDNRNSGNTSDSGNTLTVTENRDESISIGSVAVDLSQNNSVTTGATTIIDDHSVTSGDTVTVDDHSVTTGDTITVDDNSQTTGDTTVSDDHSVTTGDTVAVDDHSVTTGDTVDTSYTYDDHSTGGDFYQADGGSSYGGDYYETGSGNTAVDAGVQSTTTSATVTNDYDYTYGG